MFLKNRVRRFGASLQSTSSLFARWSTYSLRLRLMFWYGGLLLLGLSCFALLVLFLASNAINMNVRDAITGVARMASNRVSKSLSSHAPYWPGYLPLGTLENYSSQSITVEVFDQSKTLLYSSNTQAALHLDSVMWQRLEQSAQPIWYNASVDGDQALIEISAIYAPGAANARSGMIGVLLVAKSLHDTNAILSELQGLLMLTGAIMLVLFLGCGWAVVGYTFSPLSDLVKLAGSIATDTARGKRLSRRVKRLRGGDEMAQVINAFNEMLSSIESSTSVQRRFIADASHELRAPLTTIQGNLAFLIRYIDDIPPAERRTMLADAHGETLRLASLVDELLMLARADANMGLPAANPAPPTPIVELDRTLLRLVRQMRRRLEIEGTALEIEIV